MAPRCNSMNLSGPVWLNWPMFIFNMGTQSYNQTTQPGIAPYSDHLLPMELLLPSYQTIWSICDRVKLLFWCLNTFLSGFMELTEVAAWNASNLYKCVILRHTYEEHSSIYVTAVINHNAFAISGLNFCCACMQIDMQHLKFMSIQFWLPLTHGKVHIPPPH